MISFYIFFFKSEIVEVGASCSNLFSLYKERIIIFDMQDDIRKSFARLDFMNIRLLRVFSFCKNQKKMFSVAKTSSRLFMGAR